MLEGIDYDNWKNPSINYGQVSRWIFNCILQNISKYLPHYCGIKRYTYLVECGFTDSIIKL
jgi:hypothetical protein